MSGTRGTAFVGRTDERAALDGVLARVRGGESAVLVIRGEAGIGKSALLRYAARQASGFRIAELAGVEAEMELPFAGIYQLCSTMFDRVDALPTPQRDALKVSLALTAGVVPDRLLVGLAMLALLSAVAEDRPLLCLVEDAQWLDAASSQILGLVARRVRAESVAIVFAVRDSDRPTHDLDGLPDLHLHGLADEDASALLDSVVMGRLDDRVRDRLVAETGGNPLALLELPGRMTAAELAGGFELPDVRELSAHIEDQYVRRIRELPEPTRQLMLLAAAEPLGDAELVLRAGRKHAIAPDALKPAEAAELLEIGESVHFRHPLVRSAVYRAAPPASRQWAHEALAEVSDQESDADRRAWHRALAATGPDEDVAAELERSAARAQARGGVAATAAFLERAAALTPDPTHRRERALAAAQTSLQAGAFTTARALLATAEAGPLDALQRARTDLLHAQLVFVSSRGTDAMPLLLAAARRLEPLDVSLARETYVDAFSAAMFGGRLNGGIGMREVTEAARSAPHPPGAPAGHRGSAPGRVSRARGRLRESGTALPGGGPPTLRRDDVGPGTAALALAGLRARARDLGRRTSARAVALERRDGARDGDAQRACARAQRAGADPGALRRPWRGGSAGLGDRVDRGGDRDPLCPLRRAVPLGVARQVDGDDGAHPHDHARRTGARRGLRTGDRRLRPRRPVHRARPV